MGWHRLVFSWERLVFAAKEPYFCRAFWQTKPIFLGSLQSVAPYPIPPCICAFCRALLQERPENSPQLQIVATPYAYFLKNTAYMLKGAPPSIRIVCAFCVSHYFLFFISGVVSPQKRTKKSKQTSPFFCQRSPIFPGDTPIFAKRTPIFAGKNPTMG